MYYLLQLTTTMPGSSGATTGTSITGIAKILALIGTLFAVLNAPSGISQLIGSDLSVSSALQSLQTTLIGSSLLGGAARMIGSTAKDATALTTYGAGRLLGGSSIAKQMQSIASGVAGNPLVSNRATLGGIQGGFNNLNESSSPSFGDFASGMISNGLPNIAKPISNINESSGTLNEVMRKRTSTVLLFSPKRRLQHMIRHDTSNDKIAKIIINWCKENGFAYSFDTKNKERNYYTYPFTIDAPLQRRDELMDLINGK